jgi:hypothetical protein
METYMSLTLINLLIWFVWGFFMSLGWCLGAWLMGKVLR